MPFKRTVILNETVSFWLSSVSIEIHTEVLDWTDFLENPYDFILVDVVWEISNFMHNQRETQTNAFIAHQIQF